MHCCNHFSNTLLGIIVYVPDSDCSVPPHHHHTPYNVFFKKKLLSQSGENALDKTLYKVFSERDTYARNTDLCMNMTGLGVSP